MLTYLTKLSALIDPRDRLKVAFIAVLMVITAVIQTAGVASIMPFLGVLADPEIIHRNRWLDLLYQTLGFETSSAFLFFLGVLAFVVFMTGTLLQALNFWIVTRFTSMQQYHLSRRLMADYLRRPYAFFLTRNSGDLAKTVLQETGQAVSGALMPAMRLLSFSLLAAAVVILLVAIEPMLAVSVAVALAVIYGLIYLASRAWLTRIGKDGVDANRERFTTVAEAFAGAKEIRLLGREFDYLERYREPARRLAAHQANAQLLQTLPEYLMEAIAFGGVLLIVLYLMSNGGGIAHALPMIGLYGLAGKQLIPALQKIFSTLAALRFNMPAVDSVLKDLGDREGSRSLFNPRSPIKPMAPLNAIYIKNLSYRYPGCDQRALHHIDLQIPARSTIGFIGASGAGKSTLVDLLLGLLGPEEGEIRIDDTPLHPENIRRWQAALGYVPQQIFLADQSVAANIALGVPDEEIDRDAVERAARLANLHNFIINDLPKGYNTVIGERGVRLSGGQRQRIGIARALYRDPEVLVFDEATSALDNTTERAVMEAIHNLSGQKTIVLVAHRLSTVKSCDCICVMENGHVIEQGNWEELSDIGTHFRRLAASAYFTKSDSPVN